MKIQAVRGMQDLLPAQKETYRAIEDEARVVLGAYGYREVGLPQLEQTGLFKRLVGENTDIVEKEMYSFEDRSGDSLTLRPEGPAGCVRFAQENGLLFNQVQRLWYSGSMFRYERPQKGRYRQFEQIGVECFGMGGPDVDAELLLINARLWKRLGVDADVKLELNSLGDVTARQNHREKLVEYLARFKDDLDEDSRRRLETNPLRILDSKVERTREIVKDAPCLLDFLDNESKAHFEGLQGLLLENEIAFEVNPNIVRGLDYYNRTVFEWTTTTLGSQGTVCGGGRYDDLVGKLGGKPTPGVGFAMGLDRLALMLMAKSEMEASAHIYLVSFGEGTRNVALRLAEQLRDALPDSRTMVHCGDGKFKAQMKKADASGAVLALIIGEDELASGNIGVKNLRETSDQIQIQQNELVSYCLNYFGKEK
ncbi:MAG: histidyl-tRNA synthetase [Candidatus Azotimanducaceae bacterium]|jgi:histidyl-tRNA synthetase